MLHRIWQVQERWQVGAAGLQARAGAGKQAHAQLSYYMWPTVLITQRLGMESLPCQLRAGCRSPIAPWRRAARGTVWVSLCLNPYPKRRRSKLAGRLSEAYKSWDALDTLLSSNDVGNARRCRKMGLDVTCRDGSSSRQPCGLSPSPSPPACYAATSQSVLLPYLPPAFSCRRHRCSTAAPDPPVHPPIQGPYTCYTRVLTQP